jgi:chemotaxis protein CheZ
MIGGGGLRTLFIKLQFILHEWRPRMVNNVCAAERQAVNAALSRQHVICQWNLVRDVMPEPRKIFRIEERAATRLGAPSTDAQAPLRHAELMQEIAALRAMLAAMAQPLSDGSGPPRNGSAARLTSELNLIAGAIGGETERNRPDGPNPALPPMTRIAHELEEVVDSTERATQQVLAAAEEIDQVANNLAAALSGKFEQGLAKDIQDLVIRIFEACNFQDLAGQRIAKVLATLNFVEDHVSRVLEEIKNPSAARRNGAQYLHGPRLDTDSGHVSQADIDAMFSGNN